MRPWPLRLCRSIPLFGWLLGTTALPALGQQAGSVEGRMRDAETGGAIEGVEVRLEGMTFNALSERDATFRLEGVAPGSYSLVATLIGYGPARREIAVRPGDTTQVSAIGSAGTTTAASIRARLAPSA